LHANKEEKKGENYLLFGLLSEKNLPFGLLSVRKNLLFGLLSERNLPFGLLSVRKKPSVWFTVCAKIGVWLAVCAKIGVWLAVCAKISTCDVDAGYERKRASENWFL